MRDLDGSEPRPIRAKTWFDEPPPARTADEEADDAARDRTTIGEVAASGDDATARTAGAVAASDRVVSDRAVPDMRGILGIAAQLGLTTFELPGWERRGLGAMTPLKLIGHHTAVEADIDRLLVEGRRDLRGPLNNFAQHRDGSFGTVAAGRANHAGPGIVASSVSYGTETTGPVPATGTGPGAFPQYDAYVRSQAAICIWHGWHAANWLGHRESARPLGRKVDPAFDCDRFRADMAQVIADWHRSPAPEPTLPITRGQRGQEVLTVQRALNRQGLGLTEDGSFGPLTEQAVKELQRRRGLIVDGIVGPKTWAALGLGVPPAAQVSQPS
jgi:hypothetical protein